MLTDEQLAVRAARGDDASLELLVQRRNGEIFRYIYRLTASAGVAEELTQETFLRLVRHLRRGKAPRSVRPWLYRVASNICRDLWKSAAYRHTASSADPEEAKSLAGAENPVIDLLTFQEERARVVKAVAGLPADLRQVIVLRFYQELKVHEIARVLVVPEGTVKSRLFRAYRRLETALLEVEGVADVEKQGK